MDSLIATIISAALLGDVELLSTVRSSDFNILIAFFACLSNSDFPIPSKAFYSTTGLAGTPLL